MEEERKTPVSAIPEGRGRKRPKSMFLKRAIKPKKTNLSRKRSKGPSWGWRSPAPLSMTIQSFDQIRTRAIIDYFRVIYFLFLFVERMYSFGSIARIPYFFSFSSLFTLLRNNLSIVTMILLSVFTSSSIILLSPGPFGGYLDNSSSVACLTLTMLFF